MRPTILPLLLATGRAGTLSFLPDDPQLTFEYSTPEPDDKNWVGVYRASGGGPVEEKFIEDSLAWTYAPKGNGTVRVEGEVLTPGEYMAFFLARDGYEWLAAPVNVSVPFAEGPVRNVKVGEAFEVRVDGLRVDGGKGEGVFSKADGDGWVNVSREGVVSGAPEWPGTAEVTVQVVVGGSSARMSVRIPVKPADELLVEELRVVTWNLWHGGTQVQGFHEKQLRFLAGSGADVVGLQESSGAHATRLGEAMGWYSWQGPKSVGAVSRHPIVDAGTAAGDWAGWVRVDVGDGREVVVWIALLGYTPYGPYDFCFDNMTVEEVMDREAESGRTGQVQEVVAAMGEDLRGTAPVFLVGDFNAPSHLDWIDGSEDEHCGQGLVRWPTSVEPTEAGLVDAFRAVYPDPRERPGITWSPVFVETEGREEPMDRIDFVYFRPGGGVTVLGSEELVLGEPKPMPGHQENEWTSDHKVVLTVFALGQGSG